MSDERVLAGIGGLHDKFDSGAQQGIRRLGVL